MKAHFKVTLCARPGNFPLEQQDERWTWAHADMAGGLGLYTGDPARGGGCLKLFAPSTWICAEWVEAQEQ